MKDDLEKLEELIKEKINGLDVMLSQKHKRSTKKELLQIKNTYLLVLKVDIPQIRNKQKVNS